MPDTTKARCVNIVRILAVDENQFASDPDQYQILAELWSDGTMRWKLIDRVEMPALSPSQYTESTAHEQYPDFGWLQDVARQGMTG